MTSNARRPVLRRCVSCRRLCDRSQLWRVVRQADGSVSLDQGMGRSAYLCPEPSCLEEARRRRRLQRGLRCAVSEAILASLEARLERSAPRPLRQDEPWSPRACGPGALSAPPYGDLSE
ncbi:YlxR family protein [Cyanobium sp. N5-Cardenillas]|nr:YlxR family protein [Cyanobium sp. N5-Cardenillas]MCP9787008.1 YlxR family protein [Cyanobium sp. N5-Cardenillas]